MRQTLLSVLDDAGDSLTTAELRDHSQAHFDQSIVIEAVYRNLTVLEQRGEVHRCNRCGRHTYWARAG